MPYFSIRSVPPNRSTLINECQIFFSVHDRSISLKHIYLATGQTHITSVLIQSLSTGAFNKDNMVTYFARNEVCLHHICQSLSMFIVNKQCKHVCH